MEPITECAVEIPLYELEDDERLAGDARCPQCGAWVPVAELMDADATEYRGEVALPEVPICGDGCCHEQAFCCPRCDAIQAEREFSGNVLWQPAS